MAKVFVSYAKQDRNVAWRITEAISHRGLDVSHPHDDIPAGASAEDVLRHRVMMAQCVVVLWSKAAAQSSWMQQEISQAIQAWSSDSLVLAALDETPLPVGLRDLSPISVRSASDPGMDELIKRVYFIIDQKALAECRPALRPGDRSSPITIRPLRYAHSISAASIFTTAVIAIAVMIAAFTSSLYYSWRSPAPLAWAFDVDPFLEGLILIILVLGAVIGAGAVWVWVRWSRWRSYRPSSPAALSHKVPPVHSNSALQVFVSYSREDTAAVDALVQQIEDLGYAIWMDRQSTGSQRYAATIVSAIRGSTIVALMCSRSAFASDHVIREVYVAGDFKKPFIAFQLDQTAIPDEILYFLSGFPRVPLAIKQQQLRAEISRLLV